MKYNKNEIEIFKRVIKDYEIIKNDINDKIKQGYTLKDLYFYLNNNKDINITNFDTNYIDFNYKDLCLSIYNDYNLYLGDTLEIWNDKELYYIDTFNNIKELKDIINNIKD